jgi:hypothetical protein
VSFIYNFVTPEVNMFYALISKKLTYLCDSGAFILSYDIYDWVAWLCGPWTEEIMHCV